VAVEVMFLLVLSWDWAVVCNGFFDKSKCADITPLQKSDVEQGRLYTNIERRR